MNIACLLFDLARRRGLISIVCWIGSRAVRIITPFMIVSMAGRSLARDDLFPWERRAQREKSSPRGELST